MEWVHDYMGIPFKARGRDIHGCDCWGLVRLVLWDKRGVILPDYDSYDIPTSPQAAHQLTTAAKDGTWQEVSKPRALDVAVMTSVVRGMDGALQRTPVHVGVMVSANHVLHLEDGVGVLCQPIKDPAIVRRVHRFMRCA